MINEMSNDLVIIPVLRVVGRGYALSWFEANGKRREERFKFSNGKNEKALLKVEEYVKKRHCYYTSIKNC